MCKRLLFVGLVLAVGLSIQADRSVAASGSTLGWWKLDDGTGTTAQDASGNHRHGTLNNGPVWTTGKLDGALQFDGTDDFVRIPDDAGITFAVARSYSLAAWVYVPEVVGGWHGIVCKGRQAGGDASYYGIWIGDNGGTPTWYYGTWPTWGSPVAGPGWYHIVVTQDGDARTKRLYLNGELDSQTGSQAADAPGGLLFGSDQEPGDSFAGKVDDVQLYSRSLTEQQVAAMLKGTMPSWLKAEKPIPADGTIGVGLLLLQWSKGETAAFHNVYLGTSPELTDADLKAARQLSPMYFQAQSVPGTMYFWRIDEVEADGVTIHTGDVWSFMTQAMTAYYPNPADKANTVSTTPMLTWMPGQGTVRHRLYFSDSLEAVTQAAAEADKGTREAADANFAPGDLDTLKTYFWRVDEIGIGDAVKTGPVWSFTTVLPVDDFESYTDEEGTGSRIYETWIDGWTNQNGATVGHVEPPFAERNIVHGGLQSMPLDYNNIDSPFYSEAVREFAPVQDWTAGGIGLLVLYVRGKATNAVTPLYVTIEDASRNAGTVVCPDPAVVTATKWFEWKIPLNGLTGVNLARVKKLYLGVGDRSNPAAGGTGLLYIDDVGLARP